MTSRARLLLTGIALLAVLAPAASLAQDASSTEPITDAPAIAVSRDEYVRGTVLSTQVREIEGAEGSMVQEMRVRLDSGADKGQEVTVVHGGVLADASTGIVEGDRVVLAKSEAGGTTEWYLADRYRLPWTAGLVALLLAIAIAVGGKRGVAATLGLAASVAVVAFVMLPQIAGGVQPMLVAFLGAVAIATLTTFITHGANRDSGIVLGSILVSLVIGTVGALLATWALNLGGIGSEEAVAITYGPLADMDLRGLLVAGVILGCLGVLDDVAATQVAAIKEIAKADPLLTARQLYRRGMRIGAHHVAALINTLFLAYAGASLPLLVVGLVNSTLPIWAFINTEAVSEEIVRTVVGSGALILAVPIATLLASLNFGAKRGLQEKENIV